jgi:carbamoyltransferase
MLVLGIGGFMHDYNCVLVDVENKRIAMTEAERLSRRKHHVIQPGDDLLEPIRQVCSDLGVRIRDIDVVAFGHTDDFDCKEDLKHELRGKQFVDVDHHLAHAAAAFFSSPYQSAAVLSVDGFGDGYSTLLAHGKGNKIEELQRVRDHDSIGLEYLRATIHLGLGGYGSEGKTQGLAPYGEPTIFDDYMNEIEITPDGIVKLSDKLRSDESRLAEEGGYLNTQLLNNAFLNNYCPRRIVPEPLTDVHMNLAASIQQVLHTVVMQLAQILKRETGEKDLVLSGGVVMNSSLNGYLMNSGEFEHVFPLPMASDRGIGLGAALYYIHHMQGVERFFELDAVYYGNEYSDRDATRAMRKGGLRYEKSDDIVAEAAEWVAQGKIIGWFQGRSEMGARALGNRSIVADPRVAEMKDIINERIKHREWFRPFAPSAAAETAGEYFDFPEGVADLSYMTFTVPATEKGKAAIPAVVHLNQTGRIQMVDGRRNPMYHQLISKFGELTSVPVVLNTSFNDMGDPIVESPDDAVETFLKTGMDVLCIGNMIGYKK